jgi:hypothetical protein
MGKGGKTLYSLLKSLLNMWEEKKNLSNLGWGEGRQTCPLVTGPIIPCILTVTPIYFL